MTMNQVSLEVNYHITQSKAVSTSLRREIIVSLAESHRKIDSRHEEAKAVTKRVNYIAELLDKEKQNRREAVMKMIDLRKKKMEEKAIEKEEKKKNEGERKKMKEEEKRK